MISRFSARWAPLVLVAAFAACTNDVVSPSKAVPGKISPIGDLSRSAAVGSAVSGGIAVQVSDSSGRPVAGVAVAFAVTVGNGSTNPRVAMTDSKGQATATWTLGTVLGPNEVAATVTGVTSSVKFQATGTPGPVSTISISPQNPRLVAGVDSTKISAKSLDAFGNVTTPTPTFVVRDPSLITVDDKGIVRVLRRGSGTYVVATAGAKSDSILVTVIAPGQSLCTAAATPLDLAVGQVVTDVSGQGFCVHASSPNAEYAIIPFFNSGIPSATIQVEVRGQGLSPLGLPTADLLPSASVRAAMPMQTKSPVVPDAAFEMRLRKRERDQGTPRMRAARAAFRARLAERGAVVAAASAVVPGVGDLMKLNTSVAYCDNPDYRTGRVVAVTDKAIVVADTANPAGGFTDAEFRSIGVTFDTLVDPVDRAAFGAPTDVDNNGHVIIFFTRAVNEQTSGGSGGVVLGYFVSRDLLPKAATPPATAPCETSNVAEIMYVLVPDTSGVVNGNRRSKPYVVTGANGTVAHEYQHMINAGRRLYVNGAGENFEEAWLDEGLAHTAEELNFWRASGLSPRTNLGASIFTDPKAAAAYSTFENNNFLRYQTYLQRPEVQAPIGFDMFDSDLQTRGAIWSFLRYAADHLPAGPENAFWTKLVNSTTTGVTNLTSALGGSPYPLLRDWAISVFIDDNAPSVDPRFQQPSWNMRSALTNGGTSLTFPLNTRLLADNATSQTLLVGNGVSFYRFSVASDHEALLTVTTGGGQAIPSTVQVAVVRVK